MGHPDRRASSTRRTPSTPTKPLSVGNPPRSAMRNSLSQRLSRLVSSADSLPGLAFRAALLGVAIAWRLANFGIFSRYRQVRSLPQDDGTSANGKDAFWQALLLWVFRILRRDGHPSHRHGDSRRHLREKHFQEWFEVGLPAESKQAFINAVPEMLSPFWLDISPSLDTSQNKCTTS